jgi:hypothetical protein
VRLEIVRYAYAATHTAGLLIAGAVKMHSLEEPWIPDPDGPGGQRRMPGRPESCVPDGLYELVPHDGTKFRNVWALHNPDLGVWATQVPAGLAYGRSAILIHVGNSTDDIEGCIVTGMRSGINEGKPWVYESLRAITLLRELLGRGRHEILIRPTRGTAESLHHYY